MTCEIYDITNRGGLILLGISSCHPKSHHSIVLDHISCCKAHPPEIFSSKEAFIFLISHKDCFLSAREGFFCPNRETCSKGCTIWDTRNPLSHAKCHVQGISTVVAVLFRCTPLHQILSTTKCRILRKQAFQQNTTSLVLSHSHDFPPHY